MAAPFNGEEFYAKRSLFGSLWGLKIGKSSSKTPAPAPSIPSSQHQARYVNPDQPCSSRSLLPPVSCQASGPPLVQAEPDPFRLGDGDFESRERSLSEQLSATLLLTSQHGSPEPPQSIQSPQDIYKEILCESAHFDHHSLIASQHHQHHHTPQHQHHQGPPPPPPQQQQAQQPHNLDLYGHPVQGLQPPPVSGYYHPYSPQPPSGIPYPPVSSPYCPNCHHSTTSTAVDETEKKAASVISELSSKTSLEDLVKIVVAAVKDAGMLGKSDKKVESPEEILRRKRQQNNEAAARYRKRQREAKMNANQELEALTSRNVELKDELSWLQDQINTLKRELTSRSTPVGSPITTVSGP